MMMKHIKMHSEPTKTCNYFTNAIAIECPLKNLNANSSMPNLKILEGIVKVTILIIRKALRSTPCQITWIGFKRRRSQESEVSHMRIVAGLIIVKL